MASSSGASGSKPPARSVSAGVKQPGLDDDENRVDFIQRTMIEREASGKRKIKPTFFPETVFVEDSDDPDFDVDDEDSGSGSGGNGSSSSSDSDDDNSDSSDKSGDDDSSGSSSDSDSDSSKSDSDSDSSDDESDAPKTSLLKTMWAEYDNDGPRIPAKKKRKPKPKAKAKAKNELSDEVMASVLSKIKSESAAKSGSVSAAESKASSNGLPASKTKKQTKTKPKQDTKADKKKKTSEGIKKKASTKTTGATSESKKKKEKKKKEKKRTSLSQLVAESGTQMGDTRENVDYTVNPLCSICLSHNATYHLNEVIQCDSCGLYCHEECYCLVEEDASGTSSSSMAPWFCDPCKAGNKEAFCELCPNQGGLFKRTGNRLWAHIVCAMYTPGAFQGSQKLPADLSGIPNSKWGGKMCSACDEESLARVGIPVKCDAGMCKEHFHITCAQKLGLLSDPYVSVNEADPFYVSCRAHMPSGIRRRQAEAYKVSQEQLNRKCLRKIDFDPRMKEKLQKYKASFNKKFQAEEDSIFDQDLQVMLNIPVELEPAVQTPDQTNEADTLPPPAPAVVPQKKVRFLENSAFAVLTHQKKVQFTEYNVEAMLLQEKNEKTVQKVSKMWNVNPGITVAFAAYYADRQRRIAELTKKCTKERRINTTFSNKEIRLHEELENKVVERMVLEDEALQLGHDINCLMDIVQRLKSPASAVSQEVPVPGPSGSSRKSKSPTRLAIAAASKKSSPKPAAAATATSPYPPVRNATRENNGRFAPKSKKSSSKLANATRLLALNMCSVCKRSDQHHFIVQCDRCRKHFHIGCCDPPLDKVPKITPTCGWMCSDCHEEEKEVSEEQSQPSVDVDAPRALRGRTNIKKPVKYTSDHDSEYEELPPSAKQPRISPPVKIKEEKEKESVPEKVKPAKKKPAAPKRVRKPVPRKTAPVPVPIPVIKEETPSPVAKRDGAVPAGIRVIEARMLPVVNLGVNGAISPKTAKPAPTPPKRRSTPKKQPDIDLTAFIASLTNGSKCRICEGQGNENNLVKCDNCNQNFHFLCLTPPTEYTPKRKGFKWYCMNCDEADDELPISLKK